MQGVGRLLIAVHLPLCAVTVTAAELADPTMPQGWQPASAALDGSLDQQRQAFVLQGVYAMAGQRSAVINGLRVRVGEHIRHAQVVEIGPRHVTLSVAGKIERLDAVAVTVKTPAGDGAGLAANTLGSGYGGGGQ
jgi:hypothetical protein